MTVSLETIAFAFLLVSQEISARDVIWLREPTYATGSHVTYSFVCERDIVELSAQTTIRQGKKTSFFAYILINGHPVSREGILGVNEAVRGRPINKVSVVYCQSGTDDHDIEIGVSFDVKSPIKMRDESISLKFRGLDLMTVVGDR